MEDHVGQESVALPFPEHVAQRLGDLEPLGLAVFRLDELHRGVAVRFGEDGCGEGMTLLGGRTEPPSAAHRLLQAKEARLVREVLRERQRQDASGAEEVDCVALPRRQLVDGVQEPIADGSRRNARGASELEQRTERLEATGERVAEPGERDHTQPRREAGERRCGRRDGQLVERQPAHGRASGEPRRGPGGDARPELVQPRQLSRREPQQGGQADGLDQADVRVELGREPGGGECLAGIAAREPVRDEVRHRGLSGRPVRVKGRRQELLRVRERQAEAFGELLRDDAHASDASHVGAQPAQDGLEALGGGLGAGEQRGAFSGVEEAVVGGRDVRPRRVVQRLHRGAVRSGRRERVERRLLRVGHHAGEHEPAVRGVEVDASPQVLREGRDRSRQCS